MKRLITEKARSEAFLPMASMRKTPLREPTKTPIQRRLPAGQSGGHLEGAGPLTHPLSLGVGDGLLLHHGGEGGGGVGHADAVGETSGGH